MKEIMSVLTCCILVSISFGQDYKKQFDQLCLAKDTIKQKELLLKWQSEDPDNPELYTSFFNYYYFASRQELLSVLSRPSGEDNIHISDSTGQTVGFLGSKFFYYHDLLQKAFTWSDEGIEMYPNRLDMRFGKIYALGEVEDWEDFTDEIVETLRVSQKNNNEWTWTYNEEREDGEEFLLGSVQHYQNMLYSNENDDLLENMRTIAEEVLKYYPQNIESLSNLSVTYFLTEEYEKGIEALLKAEALNSDDDIVIANIAHGYRMSGDTDKSIAYYEKLLKSKDSEAVEYAKRLLEDLRKE